MSPEKLRVKLKVQQLCPELLIEVTNYERTSLSKLMKVLQLTCLFTGAVSHRGWSLMSRDEELESGACNYELAG